LINQHNQRVVAGTPAIILYFPLRGYNYFGQPGRDQNQHQHTGASHSVFRHIGSDRL